MWRNPKYGGAIEAEPQRRQAPTPTGRHVASIDRPGFRSGPNQQLRIGVDAVENGPLYIALRVWEQGPTGDWFPTRTGVTVRAREADEVVAAIQQAATLAHDELVANQVHAHNARIKAGHPGEPIDHSPRDPRSTPPQPVWARVTSSTPAPARAPSRRAALTHQGHRQTAEPQQPPWMWTGRDVNTRPDPGLSSNPTFDEG